MLDFNSILMVIVAVAVIFVSLDLYLRNNKVDPATLLIVLQTIEKALNAPKADSEVIDTVKRIEAALAAIAKPTPVTIAPATPPVVVVDPPTSPDSATG